MNGFELLITCGVWVAVMAVAAWLIVRVDDWLTWRERRRRMAAAVARWDRADQVNERLDRLAEAAMRAECERLLREFTQGSP